MQFLENFIVENFLLLFLLFVGISFFAGYKKSRNEISGKVINNNIKVIFSKAEYNDLKKQAESVLNNTTISFSGKDVKASEDKMNLYYCTVSIGNHIIRRGTFSISDVGVI